MSSYREHFAAPGAAQAYEDGQYRPGSFWDLVWTLEKRVLDRVCVEQRARSGTLAYLDFACGTGRVLAHLEDRCDRARGIDVSPEMLERARARVRKAELVCVDVTREGAPLEDVYDLVTAFRFLLNAEPALRAAALRALARRLRDGRSRLVLNTHGNPLSYKGLVVPARRLLGARGADERLLSVREVVALLDAAGLEVETRHGMGLLPAPLGSRLPRGLALGIEGALARAPGLGALGVDQVLVCRLKGA